MARACERLHAMRAWPVLAQILPDLIEVRTIAGELSAARRGHDTMEEAFARSPDPFTGVHRAYARGVLERARGKTDTAVEALRAAAVAAGGIGARLIEARAAEHLGAALTGSERVDALTRAGRLFAAFPADALEGRVLLALRSEGGAGRRAAQTIGALTPREKEVAALARRGLTVRTIAEELHLSPRTVESHLAHIYAKLGISGRDGLARPTEPPTR